MPNDRKHKTALLLTHQSGSKYSKKASCKTFIKTTMDIWTAARGRGRGMIRERGRMNGSQVKSYLQHNGWSCMTVRLKVMLLLQVDEVLWSDPVRWSNAA